MKPGTRRQDGRDPGDRADLPEAQHQQEQHRPDQVELLLDGERPGGAQRAAAGRGTEGSEVGQVHQVASRRNGIRFLAAPPRQRKDQADRNDNSTQHQQRRPEPGEPFGVEHPNAQPARGAVLLHDQQGDDKATEREENVHADGSTGANPVTVWKRKTPATATVRSPSSACCRPDTSPSSGGAGRSLMFRIPLLDQKFTHQAYITFP
ncbi:hypothetical protein AHiyo4_40030 [Arthrobacter sp. Hiyo4]|nr:hypothetical protein AHiyo4_40030 [Arthrobacter sp. Hiyo4]